MQKTVHGADQRAPLLVRTLLGDVRQPLEPVIVLGDPHQHPSQGQLGMLRAILLPQLQDLITKIRPIRSPPRYLRLQHRDSPVVIRQFLPEGCGQRLRYGALVLVGVVAEVLELVVEEADPGEPLHEAPVPGRDALRGLRVEHVAEAVRLLPQVLAFHPLEAVNQVLQQFVLRNVTGYWNIQCYDLNGLLS